MLRGAVGVAKAITRTDRAPESVIVERRRSCLACPELRYQMCQQCKCAIFLKVLVASEECPLGRWERK